MVSLNKIQVTNIYTSMKKYLNIVCLTLVAALFAACSDEEVLMPTADFTVSATDVGINQTVTFAFTGSNAVQAVVFPGDAGHDWDLVNQGSTGLVMSKGVATYAYPTAGVYTATIVATNYDKEGRESKMAVAKVTITVTDDNNQLRSVILQKDLYNKEMAAEIGDDYVLVPMPYKVRVNNRDIAVKANAQRLGITAMSPNATIDISGEPYSDKTKYDLTASPTIGVTAASGLVKTYQVYTLSYPVFETFSIDGVAGTTTYSAYSYDKTFVSVTLPSGTDLTRLKPVFSSADALSVSIDGQPQTSGMSEVDFSQTVTYTLTNQLADHPECRCESQVVVEVTVK